MQNEGVRLLFKAKSKEFQDIYSKTGILHRIRHGVILHRFERTFERLGDLRGKRILDIGCGPGNYSFRAIRAGASEVVGIDFAEEMILLCRRKAEKDHIENVRFEVADFFSWKSAELFDVVMGIGFYDYLSDPSEALERMISLCRETIVASFPVLWDWRTPLRKIRLSLLGCPVKFYTRKSIENMIHKNGIFNYEIEYLGRDYLLFAFVKDKNEIL